MKIIGRLFVKHNAVYWDMYFLFSTNLVLINKRSWHSKKNWDTLKIIRTLNKFKFINLHPVYINLCMYVAISQYCSKSFYHVHDWHCWSWFLINFDCLNAFDQVPSLAKNNEHNCRSDNGNSEGGQSLHSIRTSSKKLISLQKE